MGRWEPDARARLEEAALALFTERGFSGTTVPDITERAGLTTRTFFRHFADKREVLFAWEDEIPERVTDFVEADADDLAPMELIESGLVQLADSVFAGQFERLRARRAIIESDAGLRERELRKGSVLSAAVAEGLRRRGRDEQQAEVIARIASTALQLATLRWLDQASPERPLADYVRGTLAVMRDVVAGPR